MIPKETQQKFVFIHENVYNGSKMTFETTAVSLEDILSDFSDFLRGCGFHFDGYLDVVSDEYIDPNTYFVEDPDEPFYDWPDDLGER